MTRLFQFAFVVAATGAVMCLAVHVLAFLGFGNASLLTRLFHGGILVSIPAVLTSRWLQRDWHPEYFWRAILGGCPKWMKRVLWMSLGYFFLESLACIAFLPDTDAAHTGHVAAGLMFLYSFSGSVFFSAAALREEQRKEGGLE